MINRSLLVFSVCKGGKIFGVGVGVLGGGAEGAGRRARRNFEALHKC